MRRRLRILPAAWLLVLLAAPLVAWLAGARQPNLTNEPKVEFPALDRVTLRDEATFRAIDAALLDRLPFRKQALDLHATFTIDGFRVSPNPDVGIASGGWRYFRPELGPCVAPDADAQTASALFSLEVLAGALVAGGYRGTITLAAGKQFVHEQDAFSFDGDAEACMRRLRDTVDARLAAVPGGLPLNGDLMRLEARGEATFLKSDTHWNWRGRLLVARRLLDRVRPGLADEVGLTAGDWHERPTDLNAMVGQGGRLERDRTVGIERAPARPPKPGSIVIVGDSQRDGVLQVNGHGLRPVADALPGQTVFCSWKIECGDALARADTVMVEQVLRDLHLLPARCTAPVAIAAWRTVGEPGRYAEIDGGEIQSGGASLDLPDGATRVVTVRAPRGDDDSIRLLKLPVIRIGANPDGTPAQIVSAAEGVGGCSTMTAGAAGESLVFSLGRGGRLASLPISVTAPPGSRLGTPELVVLDGTDRRAR